MISPFILYTRTEILLGKFLCYFLIILLYYFSKNIHIYVNLKGNQFDVQKVCLSVDNGNSGCGVESLKQTQHTRVLCLGSLFSRIDVGTRARRVKVKSPSAFVGTQLCTLGQTKHLLLSMPVICVVKHCMFFNEIILQRRFIVCDFAILFF